MADEHAPHVYVIAEAGVNHNGDLEIAKDLVKAAAEAGADAVKFQTFNAANLVTKDARQAEYQIQNTQHEEAQYEMLKRLELDLDAHRILLDVCGDYQIDFLSSAFDVQSADILIDELGLDTIKLGSGELTNAPLLLHIAQKGCDVILSTGMANMDEIEAALSVLAYGYAHDAPPSSHNDFDDLDDHAKTVLLKQVRLLHCTTSYPCAYEDVNLRAMQTMREHFDVPVGYSDHTEDHYTAVAAVAMGACVIEKHITLDKGMSGPDHKASMEPGAFKETVSAIRQTSLVLGQAEKGPTAAEQAIKSVVRKSIVASGDIQKGDVFTEDNVTTKRPDGGLGPRLYWDVLGRSASRAYAEDDMIEEVLK
jgi:N-acetylneuraminate synthase